VRDGEFFGALKSRLTGTELNEAVGRALMKTAEELP